MTSFKVWRESDERSVSEIAAASPAKAAESYARCKGLRPPARLVVANGKASYEATVLGGGGVLVKARD